MMGFKIATWNINGLRSFGGVSGWRKIFSDFDADLICFQETKINRSSVEEWMAFVPDYSSYFAFPRGQLQNSGYSGVATFCRESSQSRPSGTEISFFLESAEIFIKNGNNFEFDELDEEHQFAIRWPRVFNQQSQIGLPPSSLGSNMWKLVDAEGRCVVTKHAFTIDNDESVKNLFVFNVYCPRNDQTRPERRHFQLRFYHMLQKRALQLLSESSDNFVIILGDYNTTHSCLDVYSDEEWSYANSYSRKWLTELLAMKPQSSNDPCFYDAFRHLNPDVRNSFTCWNVMLGCRTTNFGSRLDYILVDHKLLPYLVKCYPLTDYMGSDHCPVVAEFDRIRFLKQDQFSTHCTKMWPEFGRGTSQASIKNFFPSGERSQVIAKMQESPSKRPQDSRPICINSPIKKAKKNSKFLIQQNTMKNYFQSFKPKVAESGPLKAVISNEELKAESEAHIEIDEHEFDSVGSLILDENSNSQSSDSGNRQSPCKKTQSEKWKALFRQEPAPLCYGHKLPCIKRKVKKPGPQQGREFYACPKNSVGPSDHPESRCKYFRWVSVMNKFSKAYNSPKKQQQTNAKNYQNGERFVDSDFINELAQEDIDDFLADIN